MMDYSMFVKQRKGKQLLMAGLFVLVLIGGWFYPWLGYFIPACMLLGISIAFFKGRKWCDWYCPRGSFWDYLIKPISRKKELPMMIKAMPFRLGVILMLMSIMVIQIIKRWPSAQAIGMFFVTMLTVTTALGIILALIFHERSWCYLCPIGTFSNLAGRNKHMLEINSEQCVECKVCAKVCPMQIKAYTFKKEGIQAVNDFDCLKCSSCVAACPKKALILK